MKKLLILFVALVAGCCHCPKTGEQLSGYLVTGQGFYNGDTFYLGGKWPVETKMIHEPCNSVNCPICRKISNYAIGYKGSCNVIHTDGICPHQEAP